MGSHISSLHDLLESELSKVSQWDNFIDDMVDLAAKEEERIWVKRQTDGELDDSRLTEGLTGEATVYKRRGLAKPEMGRPQIKYVVCFSKYIQLTIALQAEAHTILVRHQCLYVPLPV